MCEIRGGTLIFMKNERKMSQPSLWVCVCRNRIKHCHFKCFLRRSKYLMLYLNILSNYPCSSKRVPHRVLQDCLFLIDSSSAERHLLLTSCFRICQWAEGWSMIATATARPAANVRATRSLSRGHIGKKKYLWWSITHEKISGLLPADAIKPASLVPVTYRVF